MLSGDKSNFDALIKDEVLVSFTAPWCGKCQTLKPILEKFSKNYKVVLVDVDENKSIAKKYGVMSIPTLILFKNGSVIKQHIGFINFDDLTSWINN